MNLDDPVQFVKGVGPQRAASLVKVGIRTAQDLLFHVPLRYEDRRQLARIGSLRPGMRVSVAGTVVAAGLRRARRMSLFELRVEDETGRLKVLFFNQPFLKDVLARARASSSSARSSATPTEAAR
jgi:ATP-dependent DNA helicase RecG